jgi:hypothetical protein
MSYAAGWGSRDAEASEADRIITCYNSNSKSEAATALIRPAARPCCEAPSPQKRCATVVAGVPGAKVHKGAEATTTNRQQHRP